ncbi:hypothetical protein PGB90_000947 [Kerria lacca]
MSTQKLQFHLSVASSTNGKTNVCTVRRVRFMGSSEWYGFPAELQPISVHADLLKQPAIKSAVSSLKVRNHFRNINITLPADVFSLYVDADENFIFGEHVLGEVTVAPTAETSDASSSALTSMTICLQKLSSSKEESLKEILRHILLKKFHPKNRNVEAWSDRFEKEISRFKLTGRLQIEVLKSCLDPSLNNWFVVTQENLPTDAEWPVWRQELVSNFGDNSFRAVCAAIGFRFIGGFLIDYVINKEKVLIECNRGYFKSVILDMVIFGLPDHITKVLNKNSITTLQALKNKLKKFEGDEKLIYDKNKFSKNKSSPPPSFNSQNSNISNSERKVNNINSKSNKKPCSIYEKRGYPNKFHPESHCWHRDKPDIQQKSANKIELEENSSEEDILKN